MMSNSALAHAPRTDYTRGIEAATFAGSVDPSLTRKIDPVGGLTPPLTASLSQPVAVSFSQIEIYPSVEQDNSIIAQIAKLPAHEKILIIARKKPLYLVYFFATFAYILLLSYKYFGTWIGGLLSVVGISTAHAQTSDAAAVVNGYDYTPWFFLIIVLLSLVSAYAALFSKDQKSNENGWDMLKILFGTSLGLFGKPK